MDLFQYNDILVYRSVYTPVKSNMYAMITDKEAVVFDPCEDEKLLDIFHEKGVGMVHILLTHEHYDHTSGLRWLQKAIDNDLYCHQATAERLLSGRGSLPHLVSFVLSMQDKKDGGHRYDDFKKSYQPYTCKADNTFKNTDELRYGNLLIDVTSTPGHSPGSACYILNNKLVFTGDTLLQNNAVITRFPESNEDQFKEISLPFLQSLDKELIAMPGHGDPFVLKDTTNI